MAEQAYETLSLEFDDATHVATITLRRPDTLNAMSRDLTLELRDALDAVAAGRACAVARTLAGAASRPGRGRPRPAWRPVLPILTQFSLGGFWSGFFVFYGRAAALAVSWPFMLLISAMIIGNELRKRGDGAYTGWPS